MDLDLWRRINALHLSRCENIILPTAEMESSGHLKNEWGYILQHLIWNQWCKLLEERNERGDRCINRSTKKL